MKEKLTAKLLGSLQVTGNEYEVHDTTVGGLFVRVTAAGAKSYVVSWARGRKKTLGRVGILTLDQARTEATQYLAEARTHGEPLSVTQGRRGATLPSLRDFIDDTYMPWFDPPDVENKIKEARDRFARVRVPLAKFEAADRHKTTDNYVAYPGVDFKYGIAWAVNESEVISRQELSDSFLGTLEFVRTSKLSRHGS